jgi:hypothetical protein
MRKLNKKAVAGIAAGLMLVGGGTAYAYWTTTGSGSGTGSTTAGTADQLGFAQDALTPMFPGDDAQDLSVTVTNNSGESAYVTQVKAYVTTDQSSCDGSDFLLDGVAAPSTSATAVNLAWTPQDLIAGGSDEATGTIQFNNKATNQDACKSAAVTIHYVAS